MPVSCSSQGFPTATSRDETLRNTLFVKLAIWDMWTHLPRGWKDVAKRVQLFRLLFHPRADVLPLMAALACEYDPHWPLRHKMCEDNQGLVSYISAAVIGPQRSVVPLNYPLTQPGLLGLCEVSCPLHPLIGVCLQENLSHTKLLAAGVSGCISASAWPTGIWTKYWPLYQSRWPFNWADFSVDERLNERKSLQSSSDLTACWSLSVSWSSCTMDVNWSYFRGCARQWASATPDWTPTPSWLYCCNPI